MMVWSLFIIGLMGRFFYNKRGSIIPTVVLPTTEIIEPQKELDFPTLLSFTKEKWGGKFFEFIKAIDSSLVIFTDDQADIVSTDCSNNLGQL